MWMQMRRDWGMAPVVPPPNTTEDDGGGGGATGATRRALQMVTYNMSAVDPTMADNPGHSRTMLDCLLLSVGALLALLLAARRLNRFERESFVGWWAALGKLHDQADAIAGGQVELLALFSNPRGAATHHHHAHGPHAPPGGESLAVGPLRLGHELKALMRAVPSLHVAIEPAASLVDVPAALSRHRPRLVAFSGHAMRGSLVFETADGRGGVELPPPHAFISALRAAAVGEGEGAGRLQCVVLNGCDTAELGAQIVRALPQLRVICWAGLAEDAAARAFASGLYDALGAFAAARKSLEPALVELAYWSGLERFLEDGFRCGDPRAYLHPPGHPHLHLRAPVLDGSCEGCCPPVHGEVVLMRSVDGKVEVLSGCAAVGRRDDGFTPLCRCLPGGAAESRVSNAVEPAAEKKSVPKATFVAIDAV
tara:strand:- start:174 stop:1445 length:1272 start_codon:yes stop_codon:yes gene_type:complete